MSTEEIAAADLESAIAGVYAGPLEEFVQRRDAVAKELRAAKRRDDVAVVKALRKPSRTAWALDAVAMDAAGALDRLTAAITATLEAHGGGGDVRQAMDDLRKAVRNYASEAARLAARAGQRIDEPTLSNAVLAVIGSVEDFDALRRGRLVDVPEGGGLDFLTNLPAVAPPVRASVASAGPKPEVLPAGRPPRKGGRGRSPAAAEAAKAAENARAEARRAEIALTAARERSAKAQKTVDDVESKLAEAEERLRAAEKEVRLLREQRTRSLEQVEAAAARLIEAEKALKEAKRAL